MKDSVERLRAENDALLNLCVAEDPISDEGRMNFAIVAFVGWKQQDWATPRTWFFRSRAEAVAAVRRAAGLDVEDMTCPS